MLSLLLCPPLRPLEPHPPTLVLIASCRPISLSMMSACSFFSVMVIESGNWSLAE
ncbi:hypothetical protein SESBI_07306 [Sesbania bispinosa]|nr:hypothetical protein SESBI_07306 [Sesbania bispinosa]